MCGDLMVGEFLHFATLGFPENPTNDDKKKYKNFFHSNSNCITMWIMCFASYKKHLKEYPLTDNILSDKTKFISWCIKMHNLVNA